MFCGSFATKKSVVIIIRRRRMEKQENGILQDVFWEKQVWAKVWQKVNSINKNKFYAIPN